MSQEQMLLEVMEFGPFIKYIAIKGVKKDQGICNRFHFTRKSCLQIVARFLKLEVRLQKT